MPWNYRILNNRIYFEHELFIPQRESIIDINLNDVKIHETDLITIPT